VDALIAKAQNNQLRSYVHIGDYMERFWLLNPREGDPRRGLLSIRLHHTLRSDRDDAFHDHPWDNVSIVLRGGYTEVTPRFNRSNVFQGHDERWCPPGRVIFRRASTWHCLRLEPGADAWSLFFIGPWKQGWGFLEHPQFKTPWRDYLNFHGEYPPPEDSALYHRRFDGSKQ